MSDSEDSNAELNSEFDVEYDESFELNDEDEDEDNLVNFEDDFTDLKEEIHAYDTPFKVLTVRDLESRQEEKKERICRLLNVQKGQAAALLSSFKWHDDTLVERYVEDADKVAQSVGIDINESHHYQLDDPGPDFICLICCDSVKDRPDMKTFALSCGHRLCSSCYASYIEEKIMEHGSSRDIVCFGIKCALILDEDAVGLLVSDRVSQRYHELLNKNYVAEMSSLTWCSAPDCQYAIECGFRRADINIHVPTVKCQCGYEFCIGCNLEDHRPAICVLARQWIKKCNDDSETSNWIMANTKDCPKCHAQIEKNGGCNHMICKKCHHHFCWMCLGDWVAHGSQYYNCSRYNEKEFSGSKGAQQKSRKELDRYLHFYNRYANHQQSLKLDSETFDRIRSKMKELQNIQGMSWIEVQYLSQAFEGLRSARKTLTWSYAFAYYLKGSHITQIFENNLRDLELAAENLSELFEKPTDVLPSIKIQMLDKFSYVSQRRKILLDYVAKGLADGCSWQYIVDIPEP